MAGDWLPMRHDLPEDPAVISIACATGLDEDSVVGKLLRVWRWFDSQTTDGNAPSVTKVWLDRYISATGFADAMEKAGWLKETSDGLSIPKFDSFISQSAKQRVLTAKRVAKSRGKQKPKCNAGTVTQALHGALPTEQNRTEQLNPPIAPLGDSGDWSEAELVVGRVVGSSKKRVIGKCRGNGLTASEVCAIVADFESRKTAYGWDNPAGVLVRALEGAEPGHPVSWPPTELSRANARHEAAEKSQDAARRNRKPEPDPLGLSQLQASHGPIWESMSEAERAEFVKTIPELSKGPMASLPRDGPMAMGCILSELEKRSRSERATA